MVYFSLWENVSAYRLDI